MARPRLILGSLIGCAACAGALGAAGPAHPISASIPTSTRSHPRLRLSPAGCRARAPCFRGASNWLAWQTSRPSGSMRWLREFAREHDAVLHSFRHYFISRCARSGVPQPVVSAWVGHSSSRMIQHSFTLYADESRAIRQRLPSIVATPAEA